MNLVKNLVFRLGSLRCASPWKFFLTGTIVVIFLIACLEEVFLNHSCASQSLSRPHHQRYITWEIPGFAYFNNQLLLHVTVAAYNPLQNHIIVSPGFDFRPIQGLSRTRHLYFDQLFHQNHTRILSFNPLNLSPTATSTLFQAKMMDENGCGGFVEITNQREDLWAKMYTSLVVRVFLLGQKQAVHDVIVNFRLVH